MKIYERIIGIASFYMLVIGGFCLYDKLTENNFVINKLFRNSFRQITAPISTNTPVVMGVFACILLTALPLLEMAVSRLETKSCMRKLSRIAIRINY